MKWIRENWFKVGILSTLLIVSVSPAYYFGYYIPKRDDALEMQKYLDQSLNKIQLQSCLDTADKDYSEVFTSDCKIQGNSKCDTNPTLAIGTIQIIQKDRDNQKDFCFKQYPQD